jgi:uncharacterized protein
MNCPNCNEVLVMAERQGIEIDYCPKCRGVWLDKGELDKIIDRAASQPPAQSAPPPQASQSVTYKKYDDDDHRHYGDRHYDPHYKKKKKGFLGDLFDFD